MGTPDASFSTAAFGWRLMPQKSGERRLELRFFVFVCVFFFSAFGSLTLEQPGPLRRLYTARPRELPGARVQRCWTDPSTATTYTNTATRKEARSGAAQWPQSSALQLLLPWANKRHSLVEIFGGLG
eukprot:scaffold7351_cov259-Pinguiococcus_pyrenoidosus.AAC.8